ncbi:MAG: hypothetical protein ACWA5P_07340 [bacterium]
MKNNRPTFLLFIILFLIGLRPSVLQAQTPSDYVKLVAVEQGKRILLKAVNKGDQAYSVFLMVKTDDFRKSASRPVLKTISPNSEELLITLIKLNDNTDSTYETDFIVNEIPSGLSVDKTHDSFDRKLDKAIDEENTILVRSKECSSCDKVESYLIRKKVSFKVYLSEDVGESFLNEHNISELALKKGKSFIKAFNSNKYQQIDNLGALQKFISKMKN